MAHTPEDAVHAIIQVEEEEEITTIVADEVQLDQGLEVHTQAVIGSGLREREPGGTGT